MRFWWEGDPPRWVVCVNADAKGVRSSQNANAENAEVSCEERSLDSLRSLRTRIPIGCSVRCSRLEVGRKKPRDGVESMENVSIKVTVC